VINTHASIKASNFDLGTPKFYNLFGKFIQAITCLEGEESLLQSNTPLLNAYWAFIRRVQDIVIRSGLGGAEGRRV